MHLYKNIKSFLMDQEFIDILVLNEEEISLQLEKFKLIVKGTDFRVLKLTKNEILVSGKVLEMRFIS